MEHFVRTGHGLHGPLQDACMTFVHDSRPLTLFPLWAS